MVAFNISMKKDLGWHIVNVIFLLNYNKMCYPHFSTKFGNSGYSVPTVRFVGILAQNLYCTRDVKYYDFITITILTYQYLVL